MLDILISLLMSVIAGITCHYICKWGYRTKRVGTLIPIIER